MPVTDTFVIASKWKGYRMGKPWLIAAMVLALAAAAPAGFAQKRQPTTRSVQGTVSNAQDAPVGGAVVQLKNAKTLQIRSFITKEDGSYYFHGLNPDIDYELKADYQGASSGSKTLSAFDSRSEAVINLQLKK
jgi:hypothetical protein